MNINSSGSFGTLVPLNKYLSMSVFLPHARNYFAMAFILALGLPLLATPTASGQSSPPQLTWGAGGGGGSDTWDETAPGWFDGTGSVA